MDLISVIAKKLPSSVIWLNLRVAVTAAVALLVPELQIRSFFIVALIVFALSLASKWQPNAIPLAFMAAAALWAGIGTSMLLKDHNSLAVVFAIYLMALDASFGISQWQEKE